MDAVGLSSLVFASAVVPDLKAPMTLLGNLADGGWDWVARLPSAG